jgi:type II secretory pathway component PulJ
VADTAATIIRSAQARIGEIDKELEKFNELREERAQLEKMVNAAGPSAVRRRGRPRGRASSNGARRKASGRAPRGQNKQAVLKAISQQPSAPAGEVLAAAGVEKRTGYTTINKAKSDGLIKKAGKGWDLTSAGKEFVASL